MEGGRWWCAKLRLLLLFADLQWRRASLLRGGSFHGCCVREKWRGGEKMVVARGGCCCSGCCCRWFCSCVFRLEGGDVTEQWRHCCSGVVVGEVGGSGCRGGWKERRKLGLGFWKMKMMTWQNLIG
ncbi:hypothetical protein DEO72_LG11g603 [Vigna unguiculata]|uniref:Secreted protein n=1 Tax=Vigna unguiculata TaxID=3917 RepID=A0A4D6NJS4_VIGUN|nr:hypothetical protein DEO72_LG11g603 [Vigna unguiculata]